MKSFDLGAVTAYALAVKNGFKGTVDEWLASLKGEPFTYEDFTPEQLEGLRGLGVPVPTAADVGKVPLVNSDGTGYVLGEGGKQPDWNQNDSTQMDFIKNKPFGEETAYDSPIVEGKTIEIAKVGTLTEDTGTLGLVAGKTYIVVWDNVEYKCVAMDGTVLDTPVVGLGSGFIGEDDSYPFGVVDFLSDDTIWWCATASGTHAVSIYEVIIHHIDPKFIKDMYGEEIGFVDLLPKQTLTFAPSSLVGGAPAAFVDAEWDIVAGQTLLVTWNGTEYPCVTFDTEFSGYAAVAFGNASMLGGEDTGEPFIAMAVAEVGAYGMITTAEGDYEVSITSEITTIKKIDNKYLEPFEQQAIREGVVFSEQEIEIIGGFYMGNSTLDLEVGKKYTVHWDGKVYELVCYSQFLGAAVSENAVPVIGNAAISDSSKENTGEPFIISAITSDNIQHFIVFADTDTVGNGTYTVGVYLYRDAWKLKGEALPVTVVQNGDKELILLSSTEGSTKKFRITVDDSGTLTAAEVTT